MNKHSLLTLLRAATRGGTALSRLGRVAVEIALRALLSGLFRR